MWGPPPPPEECTHGCHAGVPQGAPSPWGGGCRATGNWPPQATPRSPPSPRARAGDPPQLPKGLFGLHQAEGEGLSPGQLPQHPGHLVVPAAHDGVVVDGLDAVTHTHRLDAVDDAPLLDSLGTAEGDGGHTTTRWHRGKDRRTQPHPTPLKHTSVVPLATRSGREGSFPPPPNCTMGGETPRARVDPEN